MRFFRSVSPKFLLCVFTIGLLSLSACGGGGGGGTGSGGGGSNVPAAPVLSLVAQSIKTFTFSWADVSGETDYRLMENVDGSSGFTQIATISANSTSYEHVVFLPGRINASYILQACNSNGCSDSNTQLVSGSLAEAVGYFKASNTGIDDLFGFTLAISGDGTTLAVTAVGESSNATGINGDEADNSAVQSGAVYVYTLSGGSWSQQAYIKASNAEIRDLFGHSVALSGDGDTLAVGAIQEDSNATGINGDQSNNSTSNSGAVYVFTRTGTVWSQQAFVKSSNSGSGDSFGSSLSLSGDGDTLAVGAAFEDSNATGINGNGADNSSGSSGAAYIFTRSGSSWSEQAYIKASNADSLDQFGRFGVELAADGNTLAVAAAGEDSDATGVNGDGGNNDVSQSGAVYVYVRAGVSWSEQAFIKSSNPEINDSFGYSIALADDGSTLAVGAIDEESNATGINGDQTNNSAFSSGAVYVFTRSGSSWSQQAYIKASNTEIGDSFGVVTISADGNTLAVSASREDSSAVGIDGDQADNSTDRAGAIYTYTRDGTIWTQQAYVKASNNVGDGNDLGEDIAMDDDGSTLAAGAISEGSAATGIDGDQTDDSSEFSGAVYLY